MSRSVVTLVRVSIAILGIAYITSSVVWKDQVVAAAGTELPGGRVLEEDASFEVIAGQVNLHGPSHDLVVRIAGDVEHELHVAVAGSDPEATFRIQPGILTMLRQARIRLLLVGLVVAFTVYPIQAVRWRMLLRAGELETSWWRAFKLVLAGVFFNLFMPGLTGGDVVKAYYAAKGSGRTAAAVMSIAVDRLIGLAALAVLAGLAGFFVLGDPLARRITGGIWIGLLAIPVGAWIYSKPWLRRQRGVRWLFARLPGRGLLRRLDEAALAYRSHKAKLASGVLMTIPGHMGTCLGTSLAGHALGMQAPPGLLMSAIPVMIMAGAVPVTYQGVGVMEALGRALLLDPPRVLFNQIVGMLLFYRLFQVCYALVGWIFVLRGNIRLHRPANEVSST